MNRRMYALAAASAAAIVLAALLAFDRTRARVTGDSPKARIDSLCRIADEKPFGAADAIAGAARHDPAPGVRAVALQLLARFMSADARQILKEALGEPDPAVRAAAAAAYGHCHDRASVEVLAQLIARDVGQVRLAAVRGLVASKSPWSTVRLVELLDQSRDSEVRRAAAAAMYDKSNITIHHSLPGPEDAVDWADLVETLKGLPAVEAAFKQTGAPPNRRPQDKLPPPSHEH